MDCFTRGSPCFSLSSPYGGLILPVDGYVLCFNVASERGFFGGEPILRLSPRTPPPVMKSFWVSRRALTALSFRCWSLRRSPRFCPRQRNQRRERRLCKSGSPRYSRRCRQHTQAKDFIAAIPMLCSIPPRSADSWNVFFLLCVSLASNTLLAMFEHSRLSATRSLDIVIRDIGR